MQNYGTQHGKAELDILECLYACALSTPPIGSQMP